MSSPPYYFTSNKKAGQFIRIAPLSISVKLIISSIRQLLCKQPFSEQHLFLLECKELQRVQGSFSIMICNDLLI